MAAGLNHLAARSLLEKPCSVEGRKAQLRQGGGRAPFDPAGRNYSKPDASEKKK